VVLFFYTLRFFVYAPNGQKFGPADVPTLQRWIDEGRLLPTSMLEDEITLAQMPASSLSTLRFPAPRTTFDVPGQTSHEPLPSEAKEVPSPFQTNPYSTPSNYYRGMPQDYAGSKDVTTAWILLVASILCFPLLSIGGIVLAGRAKKAGNPQATAPFIANIVYTCLWAAGCVFYGLFVIFALSTGSIN
jgi:hypothetical protein